MEDFLSSVAIDELDDEKLLNFDDNWIRLVTYRWEYESGLERKFK